MRRRWIRLAFLPALFSLVGSSSMTGTAIGGSGAAPGPVAAREVRPAAPTIGTWHPPAGSKQMPLWPGGAPDMAGFDLPPEYSRTATNPDRFGGLPVTGVYNVSTPTITVFPPRRPGSGTAMLVFPGGGFQQLAIDLEGTEACDWMTGEGITCILVKYRVPRTDTYGDGTCRCQVTPKVLRALQDAQRAIRTVRARASELHVRPDRIGVIGFSAGGYLVAQTSNILAPAYKPVDAVDRISSRPDFAVAAYPGHLCREGTTFDATIHVTKRTPPTFIVQDWDDATDAICNSTMYARALDAAGVPAEVHLFAKGDHAFGFRRIDHPVVMWPKLAERWLREIGML